MDWKCDCAFEVRLRRASERASGREILFALATASHLVSDFRLCASASFARTMKADSARPIRCAFFAWRSPLPLALPQLSFLFVFALLVFVSLAFIAF